MKTLYISDLDGTLLHPNIQVSKQSTRIINDLIDQGMLFSIATARTIASVKPILKGVNIQVPIVLMNGVCIYDLQKEEYLSIEVLPAASVMQLMRFLCEHHLKGFAYTIKNGIMSTYYEDLSTRAMKDFYQERVDRYQKQFTQIDTFTQLTKEPLVYFSLMDSYEKLEPLYQSLEGHPDLNFVFYKDNYSPDLWYLEIFSRTASKYYAVQHLRSYLALDRIICFGDNRNDLPLFEACDYKIAVANAVAELKEKADRIIGYNHQDGVALWLMENVT